MADTDEDRGGRVRVGARVEAPEVTLGPQVLREPVVPLRSLAGQRGELGDHLRLGEQTGQLPSMLQRAATQLSQEVQRRALQFATLLEPLLIVGMGMVVMLIVLAVLLPIIQLNQWVR